MLTSKCMTYNDLMFIGQTRKLKDSVSYESNMMNRLGKNCKSQQKNQEQDYRTKILSSADRVRLVEPL